MRRVMLWLPLGLFVVALIVAVNGYLTQRYSATVQAFSDLSALAQFLGEFAAMHDDTLPESWDSLVADGYVVKDKKAAARLVIPIEDQASNSSERGNPIYRPAQLRWLPHVRLTSYALSDGVVLESSTLRPARLLWIENLSPKVSNEQLCNALLIQSWQSARESVGRTGSGVR